MATAERALVGDFPEDGARKDRKMSLGQHLLELRKRVMIAAAALVVAMIVAFFLTDPLIAWMTAPIRDIAESSGDAGRINDVQVMYTTITGAFDQRLRIAFAVGLLLSAPVWLWQIWAFLVPGLTKKEVRVTVGFLSAAIPLFFIGAYVGMLILPNIVRMMSTFTPEGAAAYYDGKYYYDFVLKLLLMVGVSFVLPVFLVALNFAGIISGKAILAQWRIAIVVALVVACIATPPTDIVSTALLTGILVLLFFLAALLSMLFDRRKRKRETEQGLIL